MSRVIRSACPMDCLDLCSLLVQVENGRVVKIKGDPDHPATGGFICPKGKKHIERLYSSQRVQSPLLRTGGGWKRIDWPEAYGLMADRLTAIKREYGPTAVLYHDTSGSNGLLKKLGRRFFNAYGGVTTPRGSLCWGSGYAAQEYDFGALELNDWDDLLNSRTIVLWGRDPATTNIHLLPYLARARRAGARVIAINPLKIRSLQFCDLHLAPAPGTDGALALAAAGVIIEEGLADREFIREHVHGFGEFKTLVRDYTPERAEEITGVPADSIRQFARRYASVKPSAIILGFGMQRYVNGGGTVRAIDALAAITGSIGVPGGGAYYAHQSWKRFFYDLTGPEMATEERSMPWPALARSIGEALNPPVKCIVEDDIIVSSWNNHLFFAPRVVDPPGLCRPDPVIFTELAEVMGLPGFDSRTPLQWLEKALEPVQGLGVTLEKIKKGPLRNPLAPLVAWADKRFPTPTGKYELYSERAAAEGHEPLPVYRETAESPVAGYPFRLLTCHHRDFIHSQFQGLDREDKAAPPEVEINPRPAADRGIRDGDRVTVLSPRGQIEAVASITDRVPPGVVQIYQGGWVKHGRGVNLLTAGHIPDMGPGTPYYDCLCEVRPK